VIKERKQLTNLDNLGVLNLRGQGADLDTLMEDIAIRIQNDKYSLIVLDPIYKLMVGRSENNASGVGLLCHDIERLVERTGVQ
jgi:RecA-family ATPase